MVRIRIRRVSHSEKSTIGELSLEECGFLCHTLEDKDRGLAKPITAEEVKKVKVAGATAIPAGEYDVVLVVSPSMKNKPYAKQYGGRFPCLLNVPGFEGILIHPGNTDADTRGCILVGDYDPAAPDRITGSVNAYEDLMRYLWAAYKNKDKITLTIE